jgi:hypothetical protein
MAKTIGLSAAMGRKNAAFGASHAKGLPPLARRATGRNCLPRQLFLGGDQLAILDLDIANIIWQLQTVALFGKLLLQRAADH